jgi:hypothetical protein
MSPRARKIDRAFCITFSMECCRGYAAKPARMAPSAQGRILATSFAREAGEMSPRLPGKVDGAPQPRGISHPCSLPGPYSPARELFS